MDEKVLQNLIALYRSKGVPLDQVINSELFKSLPVEKKLVVMKALGRQSQDKLSTINKDDVKKILLGLGLGTLAVLYGKGMLDTAKAGIAFNKANIVGIANGTTQAFSLLPGPTVTLATGGLFMGAGKELAEAYQGWDHKNQLKQMNMSNDNNILHYLSERERYVSA